jgi:hypothetical protein
MLMRPGALRLRTTLTRALPFCLAHAATDVIRVVHAYGRLVIRRSPSVIALAGSG